MDHEIGLAAVVTVTVAGSLVFSGPRLSGSEMFAGRIPWDALSVLTVVLPVCVGTIHAVPEWLGMVALLVGLACLVLGSTCQLLLSVGVVLLLVAFASASWSAAASNAAGP